MAKPTQLVSQSDVFSLPLPRDQDEKWYSDRGRKDRRKGLSLRIRRTGGTEIRTWVYLYTWGQQRERLTLGLASEITLAEARDRVGCVKEESKTQNKRPADVWHTKPESVAKPVTVGEKIPVYLAARDPETAKSDRLRMSERGFAEVKRYLENYWKPLHKMPYGEITRSHVTKRLDELTEEKGAITSDRARTALSGFYTWLIEADDNLTNPVTGSRRHGDGKPSERVLSDAELVSVWNACDPKTDYGRIVRLLMLTACRREEISGLRWPEIHGLETQGESLIALPGDRTKNRQPHVVPLSAPAVTILGAVPRRHGREQVFGDGDGGFSGYSRAKATLDQRCGVKKWVLHDIRRTIRSTMQSRLEVLPHVGEALLNHLPPKLIRTYAPVPGDLCRHPERDPYLADKRKAVDSWAGHLLTLLAKAEGVNVEPLRKAKSA